MMDIVAYIRKELGEPIINVELSPDQIEQQYQNAKDIVSHYKCNDESGILVKKLAVAYCFKSWGLSLGKYDILLNDNSKINHYAIYLHGCNEESMALSMILKDK